MITRRAFGAGALAAPWLAAAAARAQAPASPAAVAPYALKDFYGDTETYDSALSPDGTRIAVLRTRKEKVPGAKKAAAPAKTDDDLKPVAYVDILDAAQPDKIVRMVKVGAYTVDQVEWGAEDRLLIWVRMQAINPLALLAGDGAAVTLPVRRILSVSADGSQSTVLFKDPALLGSLYDLGAVVDYLPRDARHILMQAPDLRAKAMALYRVDIDTGEAVRTELGRWNTYGWITNEGVAVLRYDTNSKGTVHRVYARAPGSSDWKFVRRTRTDQEPDFFYAAPTDRPGVVLAGARSEGEDTVALRELDLRTLAFGPPIHRRDGQDVVGALVDERGRFLGVKYMDDRVAYDFVDPAMAGHFKGINRYLGDERNVSIFDVDAAQNRFVAYVSGPRDPGQQIFYDKVARRVVSLGSLRPNLAEERLGRSTALRVKTRDGHAITAYLTAPPGEKRGPLLVWPHGGPELRDYMDYDRTVQIFAAQGWWVLQPNFRGSGGYGQAFVAAGRRRWADRMQEDVEDAVAHVVDLGKVDPRRIAIGGVSYGGYAALMGAVRRPDLYRAAISVCGPSDMLALLKSEKKEDDDSYDYWAYTIGDPAADRAMLEVASPARRAAEIRAPVLLIHGLEDKVVLPEQSRLMARALTAAGKPHELIEVSGFAHANWDDEKDQALMARKIDFLSRAFA